MSLNNVHFFSTDLVREEVIVILASQFLMFFNQTALEVCYTPFFFFLSFFFKVINPEISYLRNRIDSGISFTAT